MQKIGFILLALVLVVGLGVKVSQTFKLGGESAKTANTDSNKTATQTGNIVNNETSPSGKPDATLTGDKNANESAAGPNGNTSAAKMSGTDSIAIGSNSGTSNGGTSSSSGDSKSLSETKPAKQNDCFAYEYHHTEAAAGKDIEDYLDYTNAFAIEHGPVNSKSVCVKVNQKPVKFKITQYKGQQEIEIGSVVGPDSVIRVSYCVGQAPCKEACAVKANRFMDDLTAENDEQDSFKESWDATNKNKKELEANAKEMRSIASKSDSISNRSVIREWETLKKQEWVCTK